MAAVTAQQVRAAQAAGYSAGYALALPSPNPYASPHVPAWRAPRTLAAARARERDTRPARLLARVWRIAYQIGQRDYARDRGLA